MTKAIDETWTVGIARYQDEYIRPDISAGLLCEGEHIASFGNLDTGTGSDPCIDLMVTEQDDARARLAACAPEALRLLIELEWGRTDSCVAGCGGIRVVKATQTMTKHQMQCPLHQILKKAGLR